MRLTHRSNCRGRARYAFLPLLPAEIMKTGKFLRIGLTGGIASGKSTVSKMLARLGAVIVDTDKISREVAAPDSAAMAAIRRRFGPEVADEAGALRRDVLGKIVFSDEQARIWLEKLLHPLIRRRAEEMACQAESAGQPAVVFDVPLLLLNPAGTGTSTRFGLSGFCRRRSASAWRRGMGSAKRK